MQDRAPIIKNLGSTVAYKKFRAPWAIKKNTPGGNCGGYPRLRYRNKYNRTKNTKSSHPRHVVQVGELCLHAFGLQLHHLAVGRAVGMLVGGWLRLGVLGLGVGECVACRIPCAPTGHPVHFNIGSYQWVGSACDIPHLADESLDLPLSLPCHGPPLPPTFPPTPPPPKPPNNGSDPLPP
jgi:hypothetical protein